MNDVLERSGRIQNSEELVTSLRVLESAATARQAISEEFTAYFAFQFNQQRSTAESLQQLIELGAIRRAAEVEIIQITNEQSLARSTMVEIQAEPSSITFHSAVDQTITASLTPTDGPAGAGALTDILNDLDGVADIFTASSETTANYFLLVDAAGDDAISASDRLADAAQSRQHNALISFGILFAISLALAVAAAEAIRRPVKALSQTADRISNGDSEARFGDAGGSVEIRAAGLALDQAAEHLALAERQTKALADGDLDSAVLAEKNRGLLGASLQRAVAALATSMNEREEFRRRMAHEAAHDGLTSLANRNASVGHLERGLARTRRSGATLAVLFVDFDNFKQVNDSHGHRAGDLVLRTVAQRMVTYVRDGDHVGRLGGDEFVIIAQPVQGIDDAVELAERILSAVQAPIQLEKTTVSVGASIGIALSTPEESGAADEAATTLLRDADLAVYKAKADGRGRIEVCDDELRAALFERADLEQALHRAIDEDEFVLFYQPIMEGNGESLHGFEALIRWNRPGVGMEAPDNFIPFAERSDLILEIDRWVIGRVARQLAEWEREGTFGALPISLNISGRHLASPSFVDDVLLPLRDLGVSPKRVIVEITESALLDDLGDAAAKLQILRGEGIRTAIDDFGTGYTSLAHLKSLPIDILKIDRSFTSDESAASLVKLIIDTGHLLGATITAEGVETARQADLLFSMGSDDLQGYFYGRPGPVETLSEQVRPKPAAKNQANTG